MNVRGAVELLGILHRSVKGLVSAAATDRDLFGLELCDRCYVRGNGDVHHKSPHGCLPVALAVNDTCIL